MTHQNILTTLVHLQNIEKHLNFLIISERIQNIMNLHNFLKITLNLQNIVFCLMKEGTEQLTLLALLLTAATVNP